MKKIISSLFLLIIFFISFALTYAETSYIYYYWQWCSHCANIDEYMEWVDGYNRLNIEKKEVYSNTENAKAMSDDAKRLWYENAWVPFLIVNEDWKETVLNWDKTIIDYFTPILWAPPPNNNKYIVFTILWLLAVLIPILIIKWWFNKE